MRPPSIQIQSVELALGANDWHCELVEGRDVLRSVFQAYNVRAEFTAQAFPELNALSVVTETPMPVDESHIPPLLELLARANKQLTLGGFEFDLDRHRLVFRITNLFEREKYDADIITSMVHCAVAELDRLAPIAGELINTSEDDLHDLDPAALLDREDMLPPTPEDGGYLD
jgi:hypothetical protein